MTLERPDPHSDEESGPLPTPVRIGSETQIIEDPVAARPQPWSWPSTPPPGSTSLPAATAGDSTAGDSTAVDSTTVDTRDYVRRHRRERRVLALSTLLGTLGLAVAFAAAGLDELRYNQPGPCATYGTAHHGQAGFGCSATAKHVAVLLPGIGIILLVLVALAVVWIPTRTPKGRIAWLGGYVVLLVLAAGAVVLAYSALPQTG